MKTLTEQEQLIKDAWSFLNIHVKAFKLAQKKFVDLKNVGIYRLGITGNYDEFPLVHTSNVALLAELTGHTISRIDWSGNEQCNSNYDEIYFYYKGVRFFELAEKEEE